jgi:type VI secretion system secreted protein Hcp
MAFDTYLKLEGVAGEATRKGFEGWIALESFQLGAANPATIGSATGGAGAGKVSLSPISFIKKTDKASPILFQNCCSGKHSPTATLALNKAGGDSAVQYLKYELKEVFIESISWSGSTGGDDTPTEAVSLAYGSINVTYTPQKIDGTADAAVVAGWDVKANAKL